MKLSDLDKDGKAGVKDILITTLGIEKGDFFNISVNGEEKKYLCRSLRIAWPREQIEVVCIEVGRENPIENIFSVDFFSPIPSELDILLPKGAKIAAGDYPPKTFKAPTTLAEAIEIFSNMDASYVLGGAELRVYPQLKNEVVLMTLGKVVGVLKRMERENG
jgi:hypothetical protein